MTQKFIDDESGSNMAFFTGFIAGAMIGAGFGILFAPRRGSELRQQVADSANSVSQAVSKTVDEWSEQGRMVYDRVRDVAARAGNLVERMAGDAAKDAEVSASLASKMASGSSGRPVNIGADRG
jgi:gas vesicle protein